MNRTFLLRRLLPVAAAVLVAAGAVAVTAFVTGFRLVPVAAAQSTPKPSPKSGQDACTVYVGHLARNLNVSADKLNAAALQAARDTIKDEVAAGTLTQAQADVMLGRLGAVSGSACSGFEAHSGMAKPGPAGARPHGSDMKGANGAYLNAAAVALGLTPDVLKQDLKAGQSISQLAAAGGVSEDVYRAKVIAAVKPQLDSAVTAGTITQAQEDAQLAHLAKGDPPLWAPRPAVKPALPKPSPSPTT